MSTAVLERYSVEEFLELPDGERFELIDGELKEREMSLKSIRAGERLSARLSMFPGTDSRGVVFGDGVPLDIFGGGYVPRPDAVFITFDRLGTNDPDGGRLLVPPELVIEVVSLHDKANEVETKVRSYLVAGVQAVWVLYPLPRRVHIRRADGTVTVLEASGVLTGEDILPGFSVAVADLFPWE